MLPTTSSVAESQTPDLPAGGPSTPCGEPAGYAVDQYDLVAHLERQSAFSLRAFGPGSRTHGIIDHITKELREIAKEPLDLMEWIDVALLAFDGAWRAGYSAWEIASAFGRKLERNESREWPDWRTSDPSKAIEHVRAAPVAARPATAAEDYRDAAEAVGLSFITEMADGSTICTSCQRGSIDGVIPHAESCKPGHLLAVIAEERRLQQAARVKAAERTAAARAMAQALLPSLLEKLGEMVAGGWGIEARQIICGRTIAVFGDPAGRDVYTCDGKPGHGDLYHVDSAAGRKWPTWGREIRFSPTGVMEVCNFGDGDSLFVYPDAGAEAGR